MGNGKCCVFQPFDKGPHDKRYEDTIAPAIREATLEPYRVDRDDGAVIPVETLHEEIRSATLCLADITTQNPNVMYELGFAIASDQDVVLICATNRTSQFPFDIQHRGVIQYAADSASDFEKLKRDIVFRIAALLKRQEARQIVATASPMKSTHGLRPHEIAALAFVMTNTDGLATGVATYNLKKDMESAGFTEAATQVGLISLNRMGFVEQFEDRDFNDNEFMAYRLTGLGGDWLVENQDKLELRLSKLPHNARKTAEIADDDVPF